MITLPKGMMNVGFESYDSVMGIYTGADENQTKEQKQAQCWHDWQDYTGVTEKYQFCKRCDLKRDVEK